jgi:ligand-binding SRPBCC domain-containing protein
VFIIHRDLFDSAAPSPVRSSAYLDARRPRRLLRARTVVEAPIEEVFAFFSRPENLGAMTPGEMSFEILGEPGSIEEGSVIDYRIRVGPTRLRWRTRIEAWTPGSLFVDAQQRGPYRAWWHEHHFEAEGGRTVMEDRVFYALPLGPLGWIAHRLFVAPTLRAIFAFRADAIRLRFRAPGGASVESVATSAEPVAAPTDR